MIPARLVGVMLAMAGSIGTALAGDWIPAGPADGGDAPQYGAIATHPSIGGTAMIVAGYVPGVDQGATYFTSDRGAHWSTNARVTGFGRPFLAGNPVIALLDQSGAILRSTDQGRSWAPIPLPPPVPGASYRLWAVNPANAAEIVVAAGPVVASTSDGGASWSDLHAPAAIASVAVDWTSRRLFAVLASTSTLARLHLDGSSGWESTSREARLVAANRGLIFVADNSGNAYRSSDGGTTYLPTAQTIGPLDLCDVRFASSPSRLVYGLDCTSGRVIRSNDDALTWEVAGSLPPTYSAGAFSIDAGSDATIYVATARGFLVSRDGGLTYSRMRRAAGAPGSGRRLVVDAVDGDRKWMVGESPGFYRTLGHERWFYVPSSWGILGSSRIRGDILFGFDTDPLLGVTAFGVSVDGGVTWTRKLTAPGRDAHFGPLVHGRPGAKVFLSATATSPVSSIVRALYLSPDDGVTWSSVVAPPVQVNVLAATNLGPQILYAGGASVQPGAPQLYRSVDSAATWEPVATFKAPLAPLGSADGNAISAIAIDPTDPARVYAGFRHPDHLLRSDDGGLTWNRITRGLGVGEVSSIIVDPANPATVYAAQIGSGVYRSADRGANWLALDVGLADDVVLQLDFDPFLKGVVYASSGSGLYRMDGRTPLPAGSRRAIEFYHSGFDHYFVTADDDEVSALDSGQFDGWRRTGEGFRVAEPLAAGNQPVCRFFGVGFGPVSTHFYTPYVQECFKLMKDPLWSYEKVAFGVALWDPLTRGCAPNTRSVARLWNGGRGGVPNHRYTTSPVTLNRMLDDGWVFEGIGSTRVFACVPK